MKPSTSTGSPMPDEEPPTCRSFGCFHIGEDHFVTEGFLVVCQKCGKTCGEVN